MATYLPGSGALSISAINSVFGRGNNLNSYRGTTYYTSSSGPFTFSSGAISMSSFYGTGPSANTFSFSISANQANANLRSLAVSAGWDQSSAVIATVNSGVYIYSTSTGTAGLTINGSFPGGVTLVNNGYIMGMGGNGGGSFNNGVDNSSGTNGGPAISLGVSCTITNNSYIGGGGGGGAQYSGGCGGGGAGGGTGGGVGGSSGSVRSGGAGGGVGASGSNGAEYTHFNGKYQYQAGTGGGGGRIMPGSGGAGGLIATGRGGKGGGSGGGGGGEGDYGGAGAGGSGGSNGGNAPGGNNGGGGGGWGATGGRSSYPFATGNGGTGGYAIALNGYTATRNGSGTTYGTVA